MKSECLPFDKIPHTSRLFLDFLSHFNRVRRFYKRHADFSNWVGEEVRTLHYDDARRQRVCAILERQNRDWSASPKTLESIARLRAGACAVVTGQQVGLFGGPLFSILKAISAVRLAADATRLGHDCVPVFWLATEDHDLAEVNNTAALTADGSLRRFVAEPRPPVEDAPISDVRFGPEIEPVVQEASSVLGDGDIADALRDAYRPGETMGSAFARLFARVFADWGVVLLDASDPELHALAEPVYRAAIVGAADIDAALLERGKALKAADYHEQVKVTASSTVLFAIENGTRVPIHRANSDFSIGQEKVSASELLRRIGAQPHRFSGNVLLRPVVQDYLLPTVAYVGGAAEVAYFGQVAVVYEELVGRVTPVLPRMSATLIEPPIKRLLDRYQLNFTGLFHPPEQFREMLAARSLPAGLQSSFDHGDATVTSALQQIEQSLQRLDPTLVEAAERAGSKMRYQLRRLRTRAARAELRRNEEIARHAQRLGAALYPNRELAEREIAGVYYLARYGPPLLQGLYELAQAGCPNHQIVYL